MAMYKMEAYGTKGMAAAKMEPKKTGKKVAKKPAAKKMVMKKMGKMK